MVNLALIVIVFYYLVRTGDLFRLFKMGKKLLLDLLFTLKKEKLNTQNETNPLEILKLRYVKGEISQTDYENMIRHL